MFAFIWLFLAIVPFYPIYIIHWNLPFTDKISKERVGKTSAKTSAALMYRCLNSTFLPLAPYFTFIVLI